MCSRTGRPRIRIGGMTGSMASSTLSGRYLYWRRRWRIDIRICAVRPVDGAAAAEGLGELVAHGNRLLVQVDILAANGPSVDIVEGRIFRGKSHFMGRPAYTEL